MNINNQSQYWDRVAEEKTFSLPLDVVHFAHFVARDAAIMDYGCGYGRLVGPLREAGFEGVTGYDTSEKMTARGRREGLPLVHISSPETLPMPDGTLDCILLVAVLTCIPENSGQEKLISILERKLKPGGLFYVMDFPIQQDPMRAARYDPAYRGTSQFGIFRLPEGVTLRHHEKTWLAELFRGFTRLDESEFPVASMNQNPAYAFRWVVRKD